MFGLYVHVPFCRTKCFYCDFSTALWGQGERAELFLAALERQARSEENFFKHKKFETLYLGGGTPSVLSVGQLERIFLMLREHFAFAEDAEITLEANPSDISAEKAARYRKLGINRISLGAQSFLDATLKRLNRPDQPSEIGHAVGYLRQSGFKNLNLDLMAGLPGESLDDFSYSLKAALALSPEHFSLYELSLEPRTVFGRAFRRGQFTPSTEEMTLEALKLARRLLTESGYEQYELLNYAKPGFESRHNDLYWKNEMTLGLGPGAYSYIEGRRFCLAKDLASYIKKTAVADFKPEEEETLNAEARERESFILALRRVREGASKARFSRLLNEIQDQVKRLIDDGLIIDSPTAIRLSERGIFLAETVFSSFI